MNEPLWEECCISAGLPKAQTVRFLRFPPKNQRHFPGSQIYGEALSSPPTIYIYLCVDKYDTVRYRDVQRKLVKTLLHELKHLEQFRTWEPRKWTEEAATPYNLKPSEIQAEQFAENHLSEWMHVAKVRRVFQSKLKSLNATQARVLGS